MLVTHQDRQSWTKGPWEGWGRELAWVKSRRGGGRSFQNSKWISEVSYLAAPRGAGRWLGLERGGCEEVLRGLKVSTGSLGFTSHCVAAGPWGHRHVHGPACGHDCLNWAWTHESSWAKKHLLPRKLEVDPGLPVRARWELESGGRVRAGSWGGLTWALSVRISAEREG